ncbi:MAG: RlmE family RNA methyltransferase [Candidatus Methanomethylophilaceae archaeon]|nr:RlmE family RNA methyltransferase [Candidatus Methanomethylophilaceae archaeon]
MEERHHEYYYKLAKKMDYRSRASFKLMQIDDRFNIFHDGDRVVDLGAAPGGWLQVAKERVGEEGFVIGVDLRKIQPLEGVPTIVGDITDDATMKRLLDMFQGQADVIISDMAPNICGHYSTDHARSIDLCMYAVNVCDRILKKNGKLVMKVFYGDMFRSLLRELESRFQSVKVHSPDASRPTSSEVYVIAKRFLAISRVQLDVPGEKEETKKQFTVKGSFS